MENRTTRERIKRLLKIFVRVNKKIVPADENFLADFTRRAAERGVPDSVVGQLVEFYKISNGTPCFDGFSLHRCDDEILFEWWESERSLWLGQWNCDVLRWHDDRFCLGDASNISYGEEYEFPTLVDLLEAAYKDWGFMTGGEDEKMLEEHKL